MGVDIISALDMIKNDIDFISEILEEGEKKGLILKGRKLISLFDINDIIKNEISANSNNFKISKLLIVAKGLKERGIECNRVLFKTLLDNILANAKKHGFKSNQESNEVVIKLSEVNEELILVVKNNGEPFPHNFSKNKFITKFSTSNPDSGSGLGGYDINRIASYFHNPEWELFLNENPIYKVIFKFSFPIKSME